MDRANPQGLLTDAEAGWLAGMIEGDGYITLAAQRAAKKKKDHGLVVHPVIGVVNNDALIVERARDLFLRLGADGVYVQDVGAKASYFAKSGPILRVSTSRLSACYKILSTILPHLAGQKAARARLLLDFVERRLSHRHCPYDAEEFTLIREFVTTQVATKGPRRNGSALLKFLNGHTPDVPRPRDERGIFVAAG